ncbi:MAG: phenylalanine--tRNA ligase subunit beta [Candidatus Marinimicrobia bacterium]|nr:phenylalanine--tRNA ligase subunit beta [Candidatus Neomarinimicrobiota bacterium]
MIINSKWLKDYTDFQYTPDELGERLTYLGLEADQIANPVKKLNKIVIGLVKGVEDHPDADRLKVCQVFDGNQDRQIICGAPNVQDNIKVPLALPGCELPEGKISEVKLRGLKSEGMIPAEDELGISDDHSGIIILPKDAEVGIDFVQYYEDRFGTSYDIDLTPNRPDCTSHIGVARDITLLTESELNLPEVSFQETGPDINNYTTINIHNPDGCPRYAARIIHNVKIKESPQWLQDRLKSIGLRPINNIVDAANFVLMETGQPLHTFDYDRLKGQEINVRMSEDGEEVVTLDGQKREMDDNILLICDAEEPVAIAGIMGLENSEITDSTTNILLESAYFNPASIRYGSKYLGLQTDASYRFERGIDPENVIYALNRVTELILEIAGGKVCQNLIDNYPKMIVAPEVKVRFERINKIIGEKFDPEWVTKKFKKLGCKILDQSKESITLKSPSWRPDLEREIDYIEEVIRIYGMEKVKSAPKISIQPDYLRNQRYDFNQKVRNKLAAYGYQEVFNNSLFSIEETEYNLFDLEPIKIKNPLSRELAYMRTNLLAGLIDTAANNINRNNKNLRFFEIGYVNDLNFEKDNKADEYQYFSMLLSGNLEPVSWKYNNRRTADIYDLKGDASSLVNYFTEIEPEYAKSNLDTDKYANIIEVILEDDLLGFLCQVKEELLDDKYNIEEQSLFVFEGSLEILYKYFDSETNYTPVSNYPAIERDISILVDTDKLVGSIIEIIENNGGDNLQEVQFYDLYQGKNIEEGKKSLTFNLIFQNPDRTLKDNEIDQQINLIFKNLKKQVNAKLR